MVGSEKVQLERVVSASLLRACRKFLARDPIFNVLPLGDLYSPLLQVSDVYSAVKSNRVVGVCTVYRAFSTPSIVSGTATSEIKRALFSEAMNAVSKEFISFCPSGDIDLFKERSAILHHHVEQQMVVNLPKKVECGNIKATRVKKNEMESLDKFYVEHQAEAWTPVQFEAGPYYCVKKEGKIVSAAGVHLVTPRIAQLGNIVTDEAYRNQGFATACTSALATDLASKGRIISLFVRANNINAIRIYERLGFLKTREIAFLIMRKNDAPKM
jgi:RimJ/RimL family protein N-acetyltransferase